MDIDPDQAKVVPLSTSRRLGRYQPIAQVRGYWEALRAGRHVPSRADIDPRGMERALGHTFILERVASGQARFRVAGLHLHDLMGMEVRGMPIMSFFAPSARKELGEAIEAVFAGPAIAEMNLVAERGWRMPPLEAKLLILPLKSDLGDITRALGCIVTEGEIGRAPRRFDILTAGITPVRSNSATAAANHPRDRGTTAGPGAAAPVTRGHLRLV